MQNRKAIINSFGSADEIQIINQPNLAQPNANEVRIKIEASTVSRTDIFIRKGIYPLLKQKPPFTLGYDFVGSIDAVGSNVTNLKIGDRVANFCMIGGNADYIICEAQKEFNVNQDLPIEKLACLTLSGITAYQIFKDINLKSSDSFLIHGGAGAIGSTLLQLCKLHSIKAVATGSSNKLGFIKSQNAGAIDYNAENYFEQLKQHAGSGYKAAIDFTNQKSFNHSFKLLSKGGKLITCAVYTSGEKIKKKTFWKFLKFGADFGLMMIKLAIWNVLPNSKSAKFYGILDSRKNNPVQFETDFKELEQLVLEGKINPIVHKVFSFDEVVKAHKELESGNTIGHIIIKN